MKKRKNALKECIKAKEDPGSKFTSMLFRKAADEEESDNDEDLFALGIVMPNPPQFMSKMMSQRSKTLRRGNS